jgi:hypothetical protein
MAEASDKERHWYSEYEPALACASYFCCSISLSLFNKLVFSKGSFNFPISVLAFQSLCAVVFLQASDWLKCSERGHLTVGESRDRLPQPSPHSATSRLPARASQFAAGRRPRART